MIPCSDEWETASIKTCHAKCDVDVLIVLEVLVTRYAANKATLLGDYTKTPEISIKPGIVRTQYMH